MMFLLCGAVCGQGEPLARHTRPHCQERIIMGPLHIKAAVRKLNSACRLPLSPPGPLPFTTLLHLSAIKEQGLGECLGHQTLWKRSLNTPACMEPACRTALSPSTFPERSAFAEPVFQMFPLMATPLSFH